MELATVAGPHGGEALRWWARMACDPLATLGDHLDVIALTCHEHVFGMLGPAQQQRPVAAERQAHRIAVGSLQFDVRGPFWSPPAPAPMLLSAVVGTQAIATLIAVFGVLMTPLGWGWAAMVWAYALFWFLIEDRVKLAAHYWLDHRNTETVDPLSESNGG